MKTFRKFGAVLLVIVLSTGLSFCKKKGKSDTADKKNGMQAMQVMKPAMEAMDTMKPAMRPSMKPGMEAAKRPVDKPKKLTFAERVKLSLPVAPKPAEQKAGKLTVKAEACKLEGLTLVTGSLTSAIKGLHVVGKQVYLLSDKSVVYRFVVEKKSPCTLKLDKTFGKEGVYKAPQRVEWISADKNGRIILSSFMAIFVLKKDGTFDYKCEGSFRGRGNIVVNPRATWGLSYFVASTVKRFDFGPKACTAKPWALQNLGNNKTRKGPFNGVNTIGYYKDLVLVGGIMATKIDNSNHRVVVAMDAKGKQKFQFGSTKKGFGKDSFGWVHFIGAGKKAPICVVDNNFRRLSLWTGQGKFVGHVDLNKLFGLHISYTSGFALAADGAAFFGAATNRMKKVDNPAPNVYEGLVYRVTGL